MTLVKTVAALLSIPLLGCTPSPSADPTPGSGQDLTGTVVVAWNEAILEVAEAEDGFLTLKGVRTAAMSHLAMHDALQHIDGRYQPFLPKGETVRTDPVLTAAHAAYQVASATYPDASERWAAELQRWLAGVPDGPERASAATLGAAVAAAFLDARDDDGWNQEAEYQWHPMAPGVYAEFNEHSGTPEGFIFGAGWAGARSFMLDSPSHFRSPPPPAIDSEAYAVAFDEVRAVGRAVSESRTEDQTHLALWWKAFAEKSHNRLARELVLEDSLDLWSTARLFALLNASLYDGYVNVFDNKFHFNHWRPYTAIRWASNDGNPATVEEPGWTNTHNHTYAFPSYPSAHGTACTVAMTVIADQFGDDRPFTMTTETVDSAGPFSEPLIMDPPTRSFDSFSEAALECALSRVYLGIHFRYDSTAGNELGRQIGQFAVDGFLGPVE